MRRIAGGGSARWRSSDGVALRVGAGWRTGMRRQSLDRVAPATLRRSMRGPNGSAGGGSKSPVGRRVVQWHRVGGRRRRLVGLPGRAADGRRFPAIRWAATSGSRRRRESASAALAGGSVAGGRSAAQFSVGSSRGAVGGGARRSSSSAGGSSKSGCRRRAALARRLPRPGIGSSVLRSASDASALDTQPHVSRIRIAYTRPHSMAAASADPACRRRVASRRRQIR